MKAMVLAVVSLSGNSKKTGDRFEMYRVRTLSALEQVASANFHLEGYGQEVIELDLQQEAYPRVLSAFKEKFKNGPVEMELETGVSRRGQVIVTGVSNSGGFPK